MKFADTLESSIQGFTFSAVRPDALGAVEYTLVTLVLDKTGSVAGFQNDLFQIKSSVVNACKRSPRADYVLLRVVEFNSYVDEVHGFQPLADIDPTSYQVPHCSGSTALTDAIFSAATATNAYAKTLFDKDYLTNGLLIVVTDGDDNASRMRQDDVKKALQSAVQSEHLESMRSILVGVNAVQYAATLSNYASAVGFDQYEDIGNASASTLAKLAAFVSRSISTQSQALGTGGPSQLLTF